MKLKATIAALLALACTSGGAAAQDPAGYYKGKTVKFLVGVAVGGGFDAYARMISPHLGRALDATVVVENQPGAGGLIALNSMASGPADGLRIHIVNGTPSVLAQLLDQDNVRYDLTKLDHLGVIAAEPWVMLVRNELPLKSPADVVKPGRQFRWGGTGPTGGPSDGAAFTCEALKLDCKIVLGYRGSAEIALAVQRGELDALYVTDASGVTYEKSGQARVVGTAARERSKLMPNVATFSEALKLSDEQQWWLDFRITLNEIGRILVASPGTPPDRLAFLRNAIKKVLTDPEVLAEGAKTQRVIEFRDGPTMQALTAKVLSNITPAQKERVREVVLKKYY